MATDPDEPHFETDAARGGSTPHIVRWILAVSLFAAIALLSVIWITGAATQDEGEQKVSVPKTEPAETAGDTTDSIVGENADEIREAPKPGATSDAALPTVDN
jgi:hypothetical protein